MSETDLYDILREGLWVTVLVSTPVLAAALVTGIVVGLLQALTSVQEMTLTFVPKLLAMTAVFWITMPFMTESLREFFQLRLIPTAIGVQ